MDGGTVECTNYMHVLSVLTKVPLLQKLTSQLQQENWEKSRDKSVARFQYVSGQQIVARLRRMTGPGWEATIDGHHAVGLS